MPISPLSMNQPRLALVKPRPTVCANTPRMRAATISRPRLARSVPSARTLWLAQVAFRAKKKAARNEANIG